jgi:hypothetical protein
MESGRLSSVCLDLSAAIVPVFAVLIHKIERHELFEGEPPRLPLGLLPRGDAPKELESG